MRMCRLIAAIIGGVAFACLGVTGCSSGTSRASVDAGSPQPSLTAQSFSLLTATRGSNPGIYDAQGRYVLLRGVNYTSLGDYYNHYLESPAPIPPKSDDFPRMAALGFNSVRLILSWSAVEPAPGQYDEAYLDRVREQIELAAKSGLYVILDMHQDAWGKYISSRDLGDAALCLPPTSAAVGWDGAPKWATITDQLPSCRLAQREVSLAVVQAFTNFYTDRDGIQSRFIAMWQKLVGEFADYRNIAGYDLFNEPHPGLLPGTGNVAFLGAFYGKLITAIRAAESRTAGKLSHIVFFEPSIEWSLLGAVPTVLPTFTSDTNIVFAPHNYCGTFNPLPQEQCFINAEQVAGLYDITFWSGEWGFWGDLETAAPQMIEFARLEDEYRVGGSFWVWAQACGDPHSVQGLSPTQMGINPVPAETVFVNRIECPGDIPRGLVPEYAMPLSRAYPAASPGRLTHLSADVQSGTLRLTGLTEKQGALSVWVPERIGSPQVSGGNQDSLKIRRVDGGFRIEALVNGAYELVVTAAP